MSRARRTAAALLVCAALTACDGQGASTAPESPDGSSAGAAAVTSQPPKFTGRQRVLVQAALPAVGDGCANAPPWVCSVDREDAFAPLETPAPATLVEARTHLADRHTSWTSVLRVGDGSQRALATARRTALDTGGMVLLMTPDRRVLAAAAPATEVTTDGFKFSDLTKADAWSLVELFLRE